MRFASASALAAQPFTRLSPLLRRALLIGVDALLLPLAVWMSFWLRLAHPFHHKFIAAGSWLLIASFLIGLPLYAFTGQYKGLTRYVGSAAFYRLAGRNGLLVLLLAAFGVMLGLPMPPCSWILLWLVLWLHRSCPLCPTGCLAQFALHSAQAAVACRHLRRRRSRYPVGGGAAAGNHRIVTFLDDNPAYWGDPLTV